MLYLQENRNKKEPSRCLIADGHAKIRFGETMIVMERQRPTIWDASRIRELVDFMTASKGRAGDADEMTLLTQAAYLLKEEYHNCKVQWYRYNALEILKTCRTEAESSKRSVFRLDE